MFDTIDSYLLTQIILKKYNKPCYYKEIPLYKFLKRFKGYPGKNLQKINK